MHKRKPTFRVLAIIPSSRGFGYVVLEEPFQLVDWGVKSVAIGRNGDLVTKVEELISLYEPKLLALPDEFGRSLRVREVIGDLFHLAEDRGLEYEKSSLKEMKDHLLKPKSGTKHDLATLIAKIFPNELAARLPPQRQPWMGENYWMGIFDAAALALTSRWKFEKRFRSAKPFAL